MSDRASLADRLALAIVEHGPSSADALARAVQARQQTVARELRSDPRFEHVGCGRTSRWHLRLGKSWDELGSETQAGTSEDLTRQLAERLRVLERRVAQLERSADVETRA